MPMPEFILNPTLDELTQQQHELLQLRQEILRQISEQHTDLLHEHQVTLSIKEQPPIFDPNVTFNTLPLVNDIADLNKFMQPYFQATKKRVVVLNQARKSALRENTVDSWKPSGYSHNT